MNADFLLTFPRTTNIFTQRCSFPRPRAALNIKLLLSSPGNMFGCPIVESVSCTGSGAEIVVRNVPLTLCLRSDSTGIIMVHAAWRI